MGFTYLYQGLTRASKVNKVKFQRFFILIKFKKNRLGELAKTKKINKMKRILHKIFATAIMLLAFSITLTAQPIGSKIKTDTSGHISYWNGVDTWIPVIPGLPGQILQFTAGVPTWVNNPIGITTTAVTNISTTTAVSGGNILSDGGAKITARGVCWSTSPNPTITGSKTIDGEGIGSFTSNITGLALGSTYFVRAYATTSAGTAYGNEINISLVYKVYDIDGNSYDTIHIGTQVWMKQNLNTSKYNNGMAIPNVTDNAAWGSLSTGARCYYNNDSVTYASTYGALYNWYTVNSGNLCPTGWHVPSEYEYSVLENYLGGSSIAGGKLKEAGIVHWNSPNTGATNESGFTALPAGNRDYTGNFTNSIFLGANLWTSTETSINTAWNYGLDYSNPSFAKDGVNAVKRNGISVRCIKDIQTNNNQQIFDIDGNAYDTVHIGTQIWMKQNLNTSRLNNGTAIPNVTDNSTWTGLSSGARCYYNNDSLTYANTYGALYNWYAVNTGNLCPIGWHVPSDYDFAILDYFNGSNSGKLKEIGNSHWNNPNINATNESGFTALPMGCRTNGGAFLFIGDIGFWWTTNERDIIEGRNYSMFNVNTSLSPAWNTKFHGFSVRCLKD